MPPPPPPPLAIEESAPTQPESSSIGASIVGPFAIEPTLENIGIETQWPCSIQHLALALTRTISLLEEPCLLVLIAKNALRPEDHHHLNEVEMDDLLDNIMHSAMESVLCAYIAKEQNKALR